MKKSYSAREIYQFVPRKAKDKDAKKIKEIKEQLVSVQKNLGLNF